MKLRTLGLLTTVLLAAAPSAAQAQVPTLDRVDSLVTAGDYDLARSTIERWWSAREAFDVPGSDRVRAHMLRASLLPQIEEAEAEYLSVILGYPTSEHTPRALLRLGQGLHATGQHDRAAGYLRRLVVEYSGRPERVPGMAWLARAQLGAGQPAAACRTVREGLEDGVGRDRDLADILQQVEDAACGASPVAGTGPAASGDDGDVARPSSQPDPAGQRDQPEAAAGAAATDGAFGAQAGAFRNRAGADDLVARLRRNGHEARIVRVPGSDLLRVRVGRLESAARATRLVAALKDAGFDAYVVRDVRQERQP